MKPPSFEYFAPTTVEEALSHLAEHGYDAKPLAGGQSLIPMMNFRLALPSVLVDLNNIPELSYIRTDEDGGVLVGAMTRHKIVGSDSLIAQRIPLIHEAIPNIGTPQVRTRGAARQSNPPGRHLYIRAEGADTFLPHLCRDLRSPHR